MKSILIIDRQKDCIGCPLCMRSNYDTDRCFISKIAIEDLLEDKEIFKAHCPLKPLPEEKHRKTNDDIAGAIDYGWNSCLAALEGKDMIDKLSDTLDKAIQTAERILGETK